jgi:hypothetical protein
VLGRADRDALALAAGDREGLHPVGGARRHEGAAAPREGVRDQHADHRRARPRRQRGAGVGAEREVADVDRHGAVPGLLQGEGAGQRPRHPVVAHGGQERRARPLGGRPELLEHPADERGLAGRVDVRGAGGDRGPDGGVAVLGERPHGGDDDVALADRGEDGILAQGVGLDPVQAAAEALGELPQPGLVAAGEHRRGALRDEALRDEPAGVPGRSEQDDACAHGLRNPRDLHYHGVESIKRMNALTARRPGEHERTA